MNGADVFAALMGGMIDFTEEEIAFHNKKFRETCEIIDCGFME